MAEESLRTKFRKALQIALAAHFEKAITQEGLKIPFEGGRIEGPQTDRDVGCVWFDSKRPHSKDANNEESFFGARVLRRFRQDQGAEVPRSDMEAILEWTFETLEDGLKAVINRVDLQAASGIDLAGMQQSYFIVTNMAVDHQAQHVTASIAVQLRNRTAKGG